MTDNERIESHIYQKFLIEKKLGQGAYGHVWKGQHKRTGKMVAIKKIFDAFQHATDSQRTFRQISILKQLNHPNIISLEEVIEAQNNRDIYLVFQYMESDLYRLIYEGKLQKIHIKYIIYQILLGLHYLHHSKIIHRDLKPSNVLINSNCVIKICDFGLSRLLENQKTHKNILTQDVATRWYRAPQVLLNSNSYDWKADIWSLGCIMAEMLLKQPLFPGKCTTDQLEKILEFTGKPSKADIKSLKSESAQVMIQEIANLKDRQKEICLKFEDEDAINLICQLLQFNPEKRLTTEMALQHPFFKQFFCSKHLRVKKEDIKMIVSENIQLRTKQYIELIKHKFIHRSSTVNLQKSKNREHVKCFSDLKRNANECQIKSKVKSTSKEKQEKAGNLFHEISQEKVVKKGSTKTHERKKSKNKQNNCRNSLSGMKKSSIIKLNEKKIMGSCHTLKKVSRLPK